MSTQGSKERLTVFVGRLIVLAVVAAIGYGVWLLFGPQPRADEEPPKTLRHLSMACGGYQRKYYPAVDAYEGPAPHPIRVFVESDSQTGSASYDPALLLGMPSHWNGDEDLTKVQLVACVKIEDQGPRIGECEFTDRTIPMYQGRYSATLYEVKTGKKVFEVDDLPGRANFDKSMCPAAHVWRENENPRVLSTPDPADYLRLFGSYVDG